MVNLVEAVPESGDGAPYQCILKAALESEFSESKTVDRRDGTCDEGIRLVEKGIRINSRKQTRRN